MSKLQGSAKLRDVASFVRGITFKPTDVVPAGTPGSVRCMRTKNVQSILDLSDVWAVSSDLVKRQDQFLKPGDILVSSANSWNLVGKCCWASDLDWPSSFGGFISVLRPNPLRTDPRYLYHWFSSARTQATVRSFGQQTTNISNLNFERCLRLSLPLPQLEEQRRIAEVLDRADGLRVKRREALAHLDDLIQSIFLDMFGEASPITTKRDLDCHSSGWSWKLLTDIAQLATGHTPDRGRPDYWNGDVPWISLTEIRDLDGRIAMGTKLTVTPDGIANSSAVLLPPGTVCFSRTASIGFVTVTGAPMATSQDFVNWICSERLNPIYLMHALLMARQSLRALSDGSTHKTIYMRLAEQFRILLPPVSRQEEFVSRIKVVDKLKGAHRASLAALDALFASLQDRAFKGLL